jgi:hypothetical protein
MSLDLIFKKCLYVFFETELISFALFINEEENAQFLRENRTKT